MILLAALALFLRLLLHGPRGPRSSNALGPALHLGASAGPLTRISTGLHAQLYRTSGGRLLARWFGNPILVIETVGRRSGEPRAAAVTYAPLESGWLVMPINAGSHRTPAWWLNLRTAGHGTVAVSGKRYAVRPRVVEGEERERLWGQYLRQAPVLETYRSFTDRDIPLVVLEREGAEQ